MDEHQKAVLEQQRKLKQGAAIIEGTQDKFRQDGYSNLLNKYGTKQDNSTAYRFGAEPFVDDMELTTLYEGNGLFAKIIDRPAEEAVKHGLDIDFGDEDIAEYVEDKLDDLEFEEKFATAEKWARLYGGSIIVMVVNDGGSLEQPLNWDKATRIDELMVFERGVVQPDYASMYNYSRYATNPQKKAYGQPEFYYVYGVYTSFKVHWTRCLPFRNGKLPERTMSAEYRFWGMPEYVKIKRALRECITSHEDSVKLLERSVQAIYSMKGLANMLANDAGEDKVLQRLQVIDMARGILNSIAIDTDGEQYRYENLSLAGIKEVIDATCNMLSAVTDIPQTILFGRSPAGMNSTGESDSENYYNMVENIQKQNMKANVRMLIDLILKQGAADGSIPKIPKYKVKFAALWSMTEAEQVNVDKTKADTELVKAQTAQAYIDTNALDPQEVRNTLAKEGTFEIQEVIEDNDLALFDDTFDIGETITIHGVDETSIDATDPANGIISISLLEEIADKKGIPADDNIVHVNMDGGPGSGNWGHAGVPGKVGGSAKGSGGIANRKGNKESGFTSEAKERKSNPSSNTGSKSIRNVSEGIEYATDKLKKAGYDGAGASHTQDGRSVIANKLYPELGYDAKPTVVSEDEFRNMEFETPTLYRGYHDSYEQTAAEFIDNLKHGEYQIGKAHSGSGLDSAVDKDYALSHTERGTGENSKNLATFALKKGSKIITDDELVPYIQELRKKSNPTPIEKKLAYDPAALAASMGYDAVYEKFQDSYNVMNRGAMVIVDGTHSDAKDNYPAAAVLVIKDGKILCASRKNGEGLCGPGGKAEDFDKSIEAAAIREAQEEFGITPLNLIPLGDYNASSGLYLNSKVFFTDEFTGEPEADGKEMNRARWLSMDELRKLPLFPPFEASLDMLGSFLKNSLT